MSNGPSIVDGFRLAYDRRGSGPAVVLLHGWPGDRQDWRAVVPLLEAGRLELERTAVSIDSLVEGV